MQLAAYRNRVEKVLRDLFETNETLQRIKRGQPVSEADLEALTVAGPDPGPDARPARPGRILPRLRRPSRPGDPQHHRPGRRGRARAVHRASSSSTNLNSAQIRFLDLLQNHIAKYGSIEVARLYEPPFTTLHTDSLDGLFPDEEQADAASSRSSSRSEPPEARDRRGMITGQLRNQIDKLWTEFWTGGITNPLTVIEQISFLMFSRLLDIAETRAEKRAARTGKSIQGPVQPRSSSTSAGRTSRTCPPRRCSRSSGTRSSRTSAALGGSESTFAEYMNDAQLLIVRSRACWSRRST